MKQIRTSIVSWGYAAQTFHGPLILSCPDLKLVSFVERSGPRGPARVGNTKSYPSLGALLADDRPDLVVIASPNDSHYQLAREALEGGCHVVVEKPVAAEPDEARALNELAQKRGLVLSVFHNRRLDNDFLTLQALVAQGKLGRIVQFESRFDRWTPGIRPKAWKETPNVGSQLIDDLGSHLIDQTVQLFGPPKAIEAWFGSQRDQSPGQDSFILRMEYPGSLVAELKASLLWKQRLPRFAITGTGGTGITWGLDPQETILKTLAERNYPNTPEDNRILGKHLAETLGVPGQDQRGTIDDGDGTRDVDFAPGRYLDFYPNIAGAIWGTTTLRVKGPEAILVQTIIAAGRRSAETGSRIMLEV